MAAGIAFQKAGWDIKVLERAPRIDPMGAALSLWPNACAALSNLGCLQAVTDVGAPIRSMLLADWQGRPIVNRIVPQPALLVTRSALQNALVEKLGRNVLKLNCVVESVSEHSIMLADGASLNGDLVVDGGGIHSVSRGQGNPRYAGYGGVLALTGKVDGYGLDGIAAEYWGESERFGVFELAEGHRYWFYMRSQPSDGPLPTLAECKDRAKGWPLPVRETVSATNNAALIPFVVRANAPPSDLGNKNTIRVGDAAHAMEPNLGQGACQALEDAAALAAIAAAHRPEDIAVAYESLRLKRVRMLVAESARARLGVHGPPLVQSFVRAALRLIPQRVTEHAIGRMQTMPTYDPNDS